MNDMPFGSPEDAEQPIVDYGDISLERLGQLDDSVLIRSLSRVIGDVDNPDEVVLAGFNASI